MRQSRCCLIRSVARTVGRRKSFLRRFQRKIPFRCSTVSNSSRRAVGGDSRAKTPINSSRIHAKSVSWSLLAPLCFLSGYLLNRPIKMETIQEDKVQRKPVRLIAAACKDMGIGKDGKLPFNIPAEFQYFMETIARVSRPGKMNMLVWGRRCWQSHPDSTFPFANALHVVLSTTLSTVPDHAHFLCQDFESAIRLAAQPPLAGLIETIWIIGGTQVYEDALKHPWCDLIYLTDVMAEFDCDVFFPEFDRELFKLQESFPDVPSGIQEDNGIKYKCQVFKREIGDAV